MLNAEDLYNELGGSAAPDTEIVLEVGGDGAIHTGWLTSIRIEDDRVILSTEER